MAKLWMLLMPVLVSTVLIKASADSADPLLVKGRVFCDACGNGHFAKSSFYLAGARVGVQCGSSLLGGHVTAYEEGKTDSNGGFSIRMYGEHEHDYCVALLLHSTHPTCNLLSHHGAFAAVLLSRNAGLADNVINTGPFSFTSARISSSCAVERAAEEAAITGGD